MKKRIFSLLLSLCMILTMFPLTVSVSAAAHSHCVCGGRTNVGDHTTHAPATDYAEFTGTGGTLSTGSYYLTADVTLSDGITIASGQTVNLCLNGFKLDGNNGAFKVITNEGTLNLCDCSPGKTGKITGGNTAIQNGGGVDNYVIAIFTMYGGSITGNTSSGGGGGVYNYMNVIFTMYGGSITGNTSSRSGGGVWNGGGTFTMSGGSITGNSAIEDGGGVCGVNKFSISGDVTISGNKKVNSSGTAVPNNVLVAGGTRIEITDALTGSGKIGINSFLPEYPHVFTSGTAVKNSAYKGKFFADNSEEYAVVVDSDQLAINTTKAKVTIDLRKSDGSPVWGYDIIVKLVKAGVEKNDYVLVDNKYVFSSVSGGLYNVVVTYPDKGVTVTDAIFVGGEDIAHTIQFPGDRMNTMVDAGVDVPPVAVGGLNKLLGATNIAQTLTTEERDAVTNNGSVDLKFVANSIVDDQDKDKIIEISNGKTNRLFLNLSVRKTVKDGTGTDIANYKEIDTLADIIDVTISLPSRFHGSDGITAYRVHGVPAEAKKLQKNVANADGEYYEVSYDGRYLKLHIKNFSTYAVCAPVTYGGIPIEPTESDVPVYGSGWNGGWYYDTPAVTNAVSYNTLGGSEIATTYVNLGEVLKLPEPPTRNGYVFSGWYFDAACTKQVPGEYRPTGAVTLYAFWQTENAPVAPTAPTTPTAPITPTDVPRTGDSWFGNILKSLIK